MKIETKLTLNNIRKNKKRAVFTTISIILCTFLIFTVMLVISSIRNGIDEALTSNDNDYYFALRNLDIEDFNKIKDKEYIDKIYIQSSKGKELIEYKEQDTEMLKCFDNLNVYLKFTNINRTCRYCNDIITTLNLTYDDVIENCDINEKLLNVHGIMDISIVTLYGEDVTISAGANLSYAIDVLILLVLIIFSVLFIIIMYNSFLITINERRREYAILNSIGATKDQITTMIFKETTIVGIIGILIGGLLSILGTDIILKIINNILVDTIYNFEISIKIQYLVLLILIVILNIYISAIIPSIEASNTSVIQGIKNNKHIKTKKRRGILESVLPVEGRIALKNLKRNKSKYRIITLLLVICMTSYIVVETYIKYEEKTSTLVDSYDVDALVYFNSELDIDYETIFENYTKEIGDNVEYVEYQVKYLPVIAEPSEAILYGFSSSKFGDEIIEYENVNIIVLDNETYNNYLNNLGEENADCIIYNNITNEIINPVNSSNTYEFHQVFDESYNLNFKIIDTFESTVYEDILNNKVITEYEYRIMDDESLSGKIVYTDEYLDFFKETSKSSILSIFINEDKYSLIKENIQNYIDSNEITSFSMYDYDMNSDTIFIKVKCENIISFSDYMENIIEEQNLNMYTTYITLENQENIIYVSVLEFLLKLVIGTIIIIGIASSINILNASMNERKKEFEMLNSIGATNRNINKMLIYECIIIFLKALIISLIISIPIIYKIIEYMKNIIVLQETLIPYTNIVIFILALFIVSLVVTINSGKTIKRKIK